MHSIAKAFLSVRLSVKRMHCDKTKETWANILIPYERIFILARGSLNYGTPLVLLQWTKPKPPCLVTSKRHRHRDVLNL